MATEELDCMSEFYPQLNEVIIYGVAGCCFVFFVVQTIKQWPQAENRRKYKTRKQPECSVSVFYTDKGRNVGMCYQGVMGEAFLLAVIII